MVNTLYAPFHVGGAEWSTQLLAERLVEKGHEVSVACTKPERGHTTRKVNGVTVHYIGLRNVYWQHDEEEKRNWLKPVWHALDSFNPFMQAEVERVIKKENPDLIHTHNLGGFSVSAWKAARAASFPIVHTTRDYRLLCPRNMFEDGKNCEGQCLKCRPFAYPRRKLSGSVDAVVGITRFILDRHLAHGFFEGVDQQVVISNPSTLVDTGTKESSTGEFKGGQKDTVGPLRVGFLGRLSPMKGIEQLLRAVEGFSSSAVELHIGGTGKKQYVQALKTAYESDRVQFRGFVDPSAFLPTLDVLVVPSQWHEPFGRVVVEAYAFGVPVVASHQGGLPEIVIDEETGLLFDPTDVKDLQDRILELRRSPVLLSRLSQGAKAKSFEFSVSRHVRQTLEVYDEVVCR